MNFSVFFVKDDDCFCRTFFDIKSMVVEMVPVKGGMVGGIVHPPIGRKNTTYILIVLAFWGVICYVPPFTGTRNNHGSSG